MKKMKVIFVNMSEWWHKPISETILKLSKSDKDFAVHMAVWFEEVNDEKNNRHMEDIIFEAHAPTSGFVPGDTYDNEKKKYVFEFEVPDDIYDVGVKEALANEHFLYGLFTDCVAVAIEDNYHKDVSKDLLCEKTAICSELGTKILHAMFPDFAVDADGNPLDFNIISPCQAYHLFDEYAPTQENIHMISQGEG